MEQEYRDKHRKSYTTMRSVYDFTMAIIILSIGLLMVVGDKLGVPALRTFISDLDPWMRYLFGGLCLLYGSFRLYRGIRHDY